MLLSSTLNALSWTAIMGTDRLSSRNTLKKRLVIFSATITLAIPSSAIHTPGIRFARMSARIVERKSPPLAAMA
jgi:hypothetical protein